MWYESSSLEDNLHEVLTIRYQLGHQLAHKWSPLPSPPVVQDFNNRLKYICYFSSVFKLVLPNHTIDQKYCKFIGMILFFVLLCRLCRLKTTRNFPIILLKPRTRTGFFPPKCGNRDTRSIKSCLQLFVRPKKNLSLKKSLKFKKENCYIAKKLQVLSLLCRRVSSNYRLENLC